MSRIIGFLLLNIAFIPSLAFAQLASRQGGGAGVEQLMKNILDFANSVLIPFIIGIGFLFFVWGMFQYFIAGGANEESKEKGKSLMINATIGFVVIIVFFGIINMLTSSTGLEGQYIKNVPTVIVPE
ncbi:MAG: hypothetical protein KBC62_00130 [Candidatus Pacebacteria bacterium]|nr:hypothetical protein [Candidatus Paceibacterota bacterium]MBP9842394.1 hypothetical protein [Candidatus Paceibacterota bacterium]